MVLRADLSHCVEIANEFLWWSRICDASLRCQEATPQRARAAARATVVTHGVTGPAGLPALSVMWLYTRREKAHQLMSEAARKRPLLVACVWQHSNAAS
jgi:hypothetical protein